MANSGSSDLRRESGGEKCELEAYNTILNELVFETNDGFACGESQKGLSWPNQETERPSSRIVQNSFDYRPGLAPTQAGTSSSQRKRNGTHQRNTRKTPASTERRKENDKRYRDKCRESRRKMECELHELGRENVHLHDENKNLVMEKESINKSLQSAETETKQLKIEIRNLKSNMANRQIRADYFLKKLDLSTSSHDINHRLEIKKLQNEIMVSRQDNWEDGFMNKLQLVQEIGNLEHENKLLKLQVDALCEKINNENSHGETKAMEW
ncbi:uncharacterized protein LOC119989999 [Tripterygium wilfordii]|uniref:uncharacterized protein LOC119989999 n=1 Tax=Tripterygium wilfordii TaxID=458696 RepID=UPI0018F8353B|nr:uncharacterized protein LOC119989999 [Tripterygium wilfordii]